MHNLSRHILIQILKIFYIFSVASFIPNVYASNGYDARFDAKIENGILYFHIKLDPGFKIYGVDAGDAGTPTHIDFSGSKNLDNVQIIWPIPQKEYFHGTMFHYIYYGNVIIPVELKVQKPDKLLEINAV